MTKIKKTIVVVLGMHRSGTSAITRGLSVLGVELGDTLMPAKENNNAKGFWEDVDINELNIELMTALGYQWDSLTPLSAELCLSEVALAFLPRAKALLNSKLSDHGLYGIKDPRVSVLLPFWQRVFNELELDVRYVIALRSPLSVASSLAKRDSFSAEKSHYLWLQYMLASLLYTQDEQRLVVDFDCLMTEPEQELARIASLLDADFSADSAAFIEYSQQFLDSKLRHVSYTEQDTEQSESLNNTVKILYALLLRLAQGKLRFTDANYSAALDKINGDYISLVPALNYINKISRKFDERKVTLDHQQALISAKDVHIDNIEAHTKNLDQAIIDLVSHQKHLGQILSEQQQSLVNNANLIVEQQHALADKEQNLILLQMQLAEHQAIMLQMQQSASWRVTSGLRAVKRISRDNLSQWRTLSKSSAQFIQAQGGLLPTAKKTLAVCKRDGIKSLPHHFRKIFNHSTHHPHAVGNNDYAGWVSTYDTMTDSKRNKIKSAIKNLERSPLIAIIMPVYNVEPTLLVQAVSSIQQQLYPNWELCIADDASTDTEIRPLLERLAAEDDRIKVAFREKNGHISAASNSALELVTADWVALMDHDDLLPEHALFHVAEAIINNPDALIFYSDEDKLDEQGNRTEPHFKSDWNPDLFFSQNYVSHLGVYHKSILDKISGFRVGVEGSQDYDLLLRCLPYLKDEQIIHIPKVLYHWRMVEGSTALASGEKNYTVEAGMKALRDYFNSQNIKVSVEEAVIPNTYHVRYDMEGNEPLVSLLIPTRDYLHLLETCVRSILEKSTYRNFEILILDNGSVEEETISFFKTIQSEYKCVTVLHYDKPFNYSEINNFGVIHAKGSIIGLVNNDIEVIEPDWLTNMVCHVVRPEIGCVGAKLYYGNNTLQHGGVILGIGGLANHSHKYYPYDHPGYYARLTCIQNLSAVTAACLLVRREVFEAAGGLDAVNLKVAFNDVDFCMKVRELGYRNLWTPYAELYHHESVSRGAEDTPEKYARFKSEVDFMVSKWGEKLTLDPYYNVNLTIGHEDFSLAWPPRQVAVI